MRCLAVVLCVGLAGPALAEWPCEEYWFTRNLIMDRHGYCFSTPLGQAVFNNADCTGRTVSLGAEEAEMVARIRELEGEWACAVDTDARALENINNIPLRMQMIDLPVTEGYESGCIGYRGGPFDLRAGRSPSAPITGRIPEGGDILFFYNQVDGWLFMDAGPENGMGWFVPPDITGMCEAYAG